MIRCGRLRHHYYAMKNRLLLRCEMKIHRYIRSRRRANMSHRRCCAIPSLNPSMSHEIHCAVEADCIAAHSAGPAAYCVADCSAGL